VKLKDTLDHYYATTGKASDVARQLAFGGFAAIWVFREGSAGVHVPPSMFMPAGLFGMALLADVLQYGVAAYKWKRQADAADEACESDEDEYEAPKEINDWPRLFFALKLWLVGLGYAWFVGAIVIMVLVE
jgi:hypothetical protein